MTTCPKFLALAEAVRARVHRLDDVALLRANSFVVDTCGVTSAGYRRPEVGRMLNSGIVTPLTGATDGAAPLLAPGLFLPAGQAAMVNAFAGHLDDYDDDEAIVSLSHCSIPSLMAALSGMALAPEGADLPTRRLLEAYSAGVIAMVTLGRVMNPQHYRIGWHASATLGAMGAAIAAATAMGLDSDTMATACGLAATQSSGPRSSFGSDAKPFQVAAATRAGVEAATLARAGLTSNTPLSGQMGFVELHGGDPAGLDDAIAAVAGLDPFTDPGMTIKAYPCCTATHPAIEAARTLRARGLTPGQISSIRVELGADVPAILIHARPRTPAEAKFSAEFCVAAGLCLDDVGLDAFSADVLNREDIQALIHRTTCVGLPEQSHLFRTRVLIERTDGSTAEALVEEAEGSPVRGTSSETLQRKFMACFRGNGAAAWTLLGSPELSRPWHEVQRALLETLDPPDFARGDPRSRLAAY